MHGQSSNAILSSEERSLPGFSKEPQFPWENPPFPRQAPLPSASLTHTWDASPHPRSLFVQVKAFKWPRHSPFVASPSPLNLYFPHRAISCSGPEGTAWSTSQEHAAVQVSHDGMKPSSAISSQGQEVVSETPYFYFCEGAMKWCEDRIPHERWSGEPPKSKNSCCFSQGGKCPTIRYESSCLLATPSNGKREG